MELKDIQNLIKFVAKTGVSEVNVELKGIKISIKTDGTGRIPESTGTTIVQPVHMMPNQMSISTPPANAPITAPPTETPTNENKPQNNANQVTIKSPMIGTFYLKPSPDKPNFVNVGDVINKGHTICIIEAMKLFNEIESEISGKIVKILVDDSSPVEFDQPLFVIEPT